MELTQQSSFNRVWHCFTILHRGSITVKLTLDSTQLPTSPIWVSDICIFCTRLLSYRYINPHLRNPFQYKSHVERRKIYKFLYAISKTNQAKQKQLATLIVNKSQQPNFQVNEPPLTWNSETPIISTCKVSMLKPTRPKPATLNFLFLDFSAAKTSPIQTENQKSIKTQKRTKWQWTIARAAEPRRRPDRTGSRCGWARAPPRPANHRAPATTLLGSKPLPQ